MGGCGDKSIRFRQALIFEPAHADMTLALLDQAIAAVQD